MSHGTAGCFCNGRRGQQPQLGASTLFFGVDSRARREPGERRAGEQNENREQRAG